LSTVEAGSRVVALSGGVGGAKLAWGLAQQLAPTELAIVCNTGDDFEHLGLTICPDLDTVMYTLAGRANPQQGWGLADESWRAIEALGALGGETWFRLGDLDLATHLQRAARLREGATLTQVTRELCNALGVAHPVWPMSDDPVRTMVRSGDVELAFQHYFVRDRCEPPVSGFRFAGIESARVQRDFADALRPGLAAAIVVCPSNPFVSVDPILSLPSLRGLLCAAQAPIVGVSPIVGGKALKGPAAKMMRELGMPASALAVARHYEGLLHGLVIDVLDADQAQAIEALGMRVQISQTVMNSPEDKSKLAADVLRFARNLAGI
jgi:LPPG:FO 2-phospho-L-lactate transferase